MQVRVNTQWGFGCGSITGDSTNRVFVHFDVGNDGTVDAVGRFLCRFPGKEFVLRMNDGSTLGATHPRSTRLVVNVGWEFIPGDQAEGRGSVVFTTRDMASPPCVVDGCKDRAPDGHALSAW